jgi:hypothetical protein
LGRLTPSFRQIYTEVLDDLRREIRNTLIDPKHKEAFNLLYAEAWRPEEAAMGNSTLPTVNDKLCIMANIHIRKLIGNLEEEIGKRDEKIAILQEKIGELEKKSADNLERLKSSTLS